MDRIVYTDKKESVTKRERFIYEYCKMKNWDPNNLTPNQLLEIVTNPSYRKDIISG